MLILIYSHIAVITEAPSPITAPLYRVANFTCKGTEDVLFWTVGGDSLTDTIKQNREISVNTTNISVDVWSSVLTIRALPINDGIIVQCFVFGRNFSVDRKGTTLTVKGQSIGNLNFDSSYLWILIVTFRKLIHNLLNHQNYEMHLSA